LTCGIGVLVIAVLGMYGCGGSKGQGGGSGEGIVVVNGKVSSRGSTPFSLLMFEASDGKTYTIVATPLAEELRSLIGMDLSIRARVVPQVNDDNPTLDLISYDLRALPSGEIPIVGYIL
jgi:hypothetical protein